MSQKNKQHFKFIIEIESDFDFSPIEKREDLYSRSVNVVNNFIAKVAADEEALKQIFVSDTIDHLLKIGDSLFANEDIKKISERYPKQYADVFLRLADASDNETKHFIYALFTPDLYWLLPEPVRIKYLNFILDRFLRKKVYISLDIDEEEFLQPEIAREPIQ